MQPSTRQPLDPDEHFYADLPLLDTFEAVFSGEAGATLPASWVVFIADIQGSTQAIAEGRYRDINFIGAACIAGAVNACRPLAFPYVFGGDGASLIVPGSVASRVAATLLGVAGMARDTYGLTLRVGRVDVGELLAAGCDLRVASYALAGVERLAIFLGDGLEVAEARIKAPHSAHCLHVPSHPPAADLTGLSCHWEPFHTVPGVALSVLVRAQHRDPGTRDLSIYGHILAELEAKVGSWARGNPVKRSRLVKDRWLPSTLRSGGRAHAWGRGRLGGWLQQTRYLLEGFLSGLVFRYQLPIPGLDPQGYLDEQVERCDFRRFDGLLRIVLEVTTPHAAEIEAYLANLHQEGSIFYGTHRAEAAIMTCVVFSIGPNSHVHFIDGAGGGFTAAAQQLKEQMRGYSL